jgi:tetraacyldisaccharide 4'-kinase
MVFKDHHSFTTEDLKKIRKVYNTLPSDNRIILTTEKDCIRLREMSQLREIFDDNFYYLPISTEIQNNDTEEFNNTIIDYVRKNRANSQVS